MELYGLLNEKEILTASLSAGVDYYKGDQGEKGEKGEEGMRGNVIFTTTTPPNNSAFYIANLTPPFLAVDDTPPLIGDFVLYDSELYLIKRVDFLRKTVVTTLFVDLKGEQGIQGEQGEKGEQGERGLQGYIFTPSVSSTGVISWSNNGELPNPSSVDLVAAVISALPSAVGVNF